MEAAIKERCQAIGVRECARRAQVDGASGAVPGTTPTRSFYEKAEIVKADVAALAVLEKP